jgi:hypothetical protein
MKIILIAKPDGYYREGTEVFNYDGDRFTKEEWDAERQRIKDAHPYPETV